MKQTNSKKRERVLVCVQTLLFLLLVRRNSGGQRTIDDPFRYDFFLLLLCFPFSLVDVSLKKKKKRF
jgi:hypothetical protein